MSNPAMNNMPAFKDKTLSPQELRELYNQPAATPSQQASEHQQAPFEAQMPASNNPMTYESTVQKTSLLFIVLLATAAVGWFIPVLAIPGALVGSALLLVNVFKKQPSVPLILGYAAAEGLFLGGISGILESRYPGIVSQAVLGTLIVFAVVLVLFRSGKLRTSPRMNKIFFIAVLSYAAFSLVNLVLMLTNTTQGEFGLRSEVTIMGIPLGMVVGLLAVVLASYSLVMDFEAIQLGVERKVDDKFAWAGAFGLTVTLIWLYVEILRIIAIFRD